MTYVIGLTGGIGSGKTLISDRFAYLGVPVIDTDIIARQVVEPGQKALDDLVTHFGNKILQGNGLLDRSELRKIAFSSNENKAILDSITHPAIRAETIEQIKAVNYQYCLVVVPLLNASSSFKKLMQRILVVTASHTTKINRVKKRSNLKKDEIEAIMKTQLNDSERMNFADDVINNDHSINSAHEQVVALHAKYSSLSINYHQSNR